MISPADSFNPFDREWEKDSAEAFEERTVKRILKHYGIPRLFKCVCRAEEQESGKWQATLDAFRRLTSFPYPIAAYRIRKPVDYRSMFKVAGGFGKSEAYKAWSKWTDEAGVAVDDQRILVIHWPGWADVAMHSLPQTPAQGFRMVWRYKDVRLAVDPLQALLDAVGWKPEVAG